MKTVDRDELAARLGPIFGHDLGEEPPITMKQLSAMRAYDATARLPELAGLPTLVISAAHDRIAIARAGRALAAAITSARYVELAEASHEATLQGSPQINDLLLHHLNRAESAARSTELSHD